MEKLLCPSLLNLSMDYLKDEIMRLDVSGADILHIDVMDGHYVPNFGMSFQDIETIRKNTSLKLDIHMMMYNPGRYIERYAEFGADMLSLVDYVLVMTVNPGFAGRDYLHFVEPKIEQLLKLRQRYKFHIVIDGGVTWEILERLWKKGVEGFVLGKQILFEKNEDYRTIIQKVRNI